MTSKHREIELPADCAKNYELVRPLSQGGYGVVVVARHRSLDREVAIKVLHAEGHSDPDAIRRFLNEARIASSVQDEHLVQILDFGCEGGLPWIAYELVNGSDVGHLLDHGPFPPERAWLVTRQVAAALAAAHEGGILHRDLKPENILQAGEGQYKLTDFGVAKWTGRDEIRTRTGVILGTPAYIAPEVIKGEGALPASDVYSLGVVLFEMLTGDCPFTGSLTEVLRAHLEDRPPVPSKLMPGLPPWTDELIGRCLVKDPARRIASARELIVELEKLPPAHSGLYSGRIATRDVRPPLLAARDSLSRIPKVFLLAALAIGVIFITIKSMMIEPPVPVTVPTPVRSYERPDRGWVYPALRQLITGARSLDDEVEKGHGRGRDMIVVQAGGPPAPAVEASRRMLRIIASVHERDAWQTPVQEDWILLRHRLWIALESLARYHSNYEMALSSLPEHAKYWAQVLALRAQLLDVPPTRVDWGYPLHALMLRILSLHDFTQEWGVVHDEPWKLKRFQMMEEQTPRLIPAVQRSALRECDRDLEILDHLAEVRSRLAELHALTTDVRSRTGREARLVEQAEEMLVNVKRAIGHTEEEGCDPARNYCRILSFEFLARVLLTPRQDVTLVQRVRETLEGEAPAFELSRDLAGLTSQVLELYQARRSGGESRSGEEKAAALLTQVGEARRAAYRKALQSREASGAS